VFAMDRSLLAHNKSTPVDAGKPSPVFDFDTQQFLPFLKSSWGYATQVGAPCPWGETVCNGVRCTAVCLATLGPLMQPITNTQWNSDIPHLDFTVCHPQQACRNISSPTTPPVSHTYRGTVQFCNPMGVSARANDE
jgi:hypothetical protein